MIPQVGYCKEKDTGGEEWGEWGAETLHRPSVLRAGPKQCGFLSSDSSAAQEDEHC